MSTASIITVAAAPYTSSGWIRVYAGDGSTSLNGPMQSTTSALAGDLTYYFGAAKRGLTKPGCRVTVSRNPPTTAEGWL